MNTLIPGAPLRSLSPTSIEYQRAQGASRAAKPARAARFTLDAPEHSGTIPGAIGDILPPGVALTSNLAVIFTLNQYTSSTQSSSYSSKNMTRCDPFTLSMDPTLLNKASIRWLRRSRSSALSTGQDMNATPICVRSTSKSSLAFWPLLPFQWILSRVRPPQFR